MKSNPRHNAGTGLPEPEEHSGSGADPSAPLPTLYRFLGGYRVSQAMYVVARLKIADLLAHGPRTSEDLAEATETHPDTLYRVLRFLAGVGLFQEEAPRLFSLTPLGAGLRSDVPGSIRPNVLMLLDPDMWRNWSDLLHTVRTGETTFEHVHGKPRFEYLREHPEADELFNRAMTGNTGQWGAAFTQGYDFSGIERLVDVGGGHGLLMAMVLQKYPNMHGIVFDRPEVVAGAKALLENHGVADRCEIIGGDFFASVPPGGDAYILRQIIHDWKDDQAIQILKTCRQSMADSARVLVIERVIGSDYRSAMPTLHIDMEMLVTVGGIERTGDEFRSLFNRAGFRLTTIFPLHDLAQFSVIEGVPV